MNFTITNKAYAKNVFKTLFNYILDGKLYRIDFEEFKSLKTQKQLGFIFGGIIKALKLYFERIGYKFTDVQIKQWLYEEIGVTETLYLPNASRVTVTKTLSGMDKKEAGEFINKLLNFIDTSEALQDFVLPPDLRYCWVNQIDDNFINEVKLFKFPQKDESYLRYQRNLTCIRCGIKSNEVHHIKEGSGLGRKNPDWFTIPICAKCHVPYLHSKIGEPNFIKEITPIIGGIDIELFCKLAYYRWFNNYN